MAHKIKIECYSHGARLSGYSRETLQIINNFLEQYMLKDMVRQPNGRMVEVVQKQYFGQFLNKEETYIHIRTVPEIISVLEYHGVVIEMVMKDIPTPVPATFEVKPHFIPKDYQVPIIAELGDSRVSVRLDLQTGKGKDQPLDAKIKVPGGWTTMGAVKVGDIITAWDGTPTQVTAIYPQGTKEVYRITFADGRSTQAGANHLWRVYYINTQAHKRWRVVDTLEVLRLINMPNPRVYVQLIESEDGADKELPLDPYTLGALIGDGTLLGSIVQLTKFDEHVFDRIAMNFPKGYHWKPMDDRTKVIKSPTSSNHYREKLKELGLWGKQSWLKFIPKQYLDGTSRAQRIALLQGLMDTDGTAEKSGSTSYTTTSHRLALDVQYLVRSLGGIASISSRIPTFTYKDEKKKGREAYQVNIRFKTPSELFSLSRKKERTNDDNQYAKDLKLRVASIVNEGFKETQCITVSHPDRLYVTDDFIVTHNTYCTLQTLCNLGIRSCAMIPPKYFGIWEKALEDIYANITGRYRMVSGSAQLKKLMLEALAGSLDTDFICIANTTYRNYINDYEETGSHSSYPVSPLQFHEICGIGAQVNDEFQEDPGLVFRIDVFTNVAKQIYLSATPYTGNAFVTRMINYSLPQSTMCTLPEWSKYIDCIGLIYNESSIRPKDYLTPFKNTYNHARYETKLLENKKRLPVYLDMVKRLVNVLFVKDFQKGQRCLILCATVEFIKHLTTFLKKEFPKFIVNAHVQGCDFAQLDVNDITISTIKSSGTGVDIRNLKECILLQATGSEKDNVQIMGRLREIKDFPDISPRFTYLACRHIPQHMRYLNDKQDIFSGKAKSHKLLNF